VSKISLELITAKQDHRWSDEELKNLLSLWLAGTELDDIAHIFSVSRYAINKQIHRLRVNGVPVPRRKNGMKAGRHNQLWTQEEIEYLVRRRNEKATTEALGVELGRSFLAVQSMIQELRRQGVSIRMLGHGHRRLWNSDRLREAIVGRGLRVVGVDEPPTSKEPEK